MATKCPTCKAENPEAARFCQVCGRSLDPGYQRQQMQPQMATDSSVNPPSLKDIGSRRTDLILATILTVVGIGVVALLTVEIVGTSRQHSRELALFQATLVNAYFVLVSGLGMMVFCLSRGRTSSRFGSKAPEPASERSFFHKMEPSLLCGAVSETHTLAIASDARFGRRTEILLYLLSFFFIPVGCMAGAILYANAKPEYRRVGKMCLTLSATCLLVLAAVISTMFVALHLAP